MVEACTSCVHPAAGARVEADRVELSESHQVGVLAGQRGIFRGRDIAIVDTLAEECAAIACPHGFGVGLAAMQEATIELSNFKIERSAVCGVLVLAGAKLLLENGVITDAAIGACVQVDDFNYDNLASDVSFLRCDRNLHATSLPAPDVAERPQL